MALSLTKSHHHLLRLRSPTPHGPSDPIRRPPHLEAGGLGLALLVVVGGGQVEVFLSGRRPLPLPRPPLPSPHRRVHYSHHQAQPLLSRPTLPPFLQKQMPFLNLSPFSSSSGSDPGDEEEDEEEVVVLRVCKVVEDLFASDRNMEAVLDQCGIPLTSSLVVAVLDRFRHAHKPAFRFFQWAAGRPGFSHDSATYDKMLSVLGKTRQFETMVALLEEMRKKRVLTLDSFKVSIAALAGAREMKKAFGMFRMMERCHLDVGIEEFNGLLFVLAKEKLGKEAYELFDKMRDRYPPDLRTYTVLLSGWCKLKNLVEAGKVWNEMVDSGLKPDFVAHNTMLEGLIKGQRRPEAVKLFEIMKAKGPQPSTCTYNILIEDLCKHGKMERAIACFEEMQVEGCTPDTATYTSLIMGFGNAKQMGEVPGLLKEMQERGCPPDGRTYNAVIKLMTNQNMPEEAARMYKRMIKNGIAPTIHTYNMMMKSYFRRNDYDGCAVWEEMSRKGVCPDDNSYTVLIGGLIRHGRAEEALKYIEEMINKGMKAPRFDYNKFAADFSRVGKPDILYELAEKMSFSSKSEASDVFLSLAERMEKGVMRRGSSQIGR